MSADLRYHHHAGLLAKVQFADLFRDWMHGAAQPRSQFYFCQLGAALTLHQVYPDLLALLISEHEGITFPSAVYPRGEGAAQRFDCLAWYL